MDHRDAPSRDLSTGSQKDAEDLWKRYPISLAMQQDLDKRFTYHKPKTDQPCRYEVLRDKAKELAELIIETSPSSREQSLALTNLEQAIMWANAGIARNE